MKLLENGMPWQYSFISRCAKFHNLKLLRSFVSSQVNSGEGVLNRAVTAPRVTFVASVRYDEVKTKLIDSDSDCNVGRTWCTYGMLQ
jgi:hypothetical protein